MMRIAVYNKTDTLKPNQKFVPALPAPPVITPPVRPAGLVLGPAG
jgi:hypothetical protein